MTPDCRRIAADAPGLSTLGLDDPERVLAEQHASGCVACARALREAGHVQALLAVLEPEPVPAAALERASREIRAQLAREARMRVTAAVASVTASVAVLVGFARSRSPAPADWAVAAVLWAIALGLAVASARRRLAASTVAVLAAVAAAAAVGRPGPLEAWLGVECLVIELATAAVVVGSIWLALRSVGDAPARTAIWGAAAAGALAGDAALQLTCPAHTAVPHLLVFHVGGVLLAAAGALVASRAPARIAAVP